MRYHRVIRTFVGPVASLSSATVQRTSPRILIVDDDANTLDTYARLLALEGYEVRTATSADAGTRELDSAPPDAIVVDLRMPRIDGLGFLRRLRARDDNRDTPVAIVTGDYFVDDTTRAEVRTLGAEIRFKPLWLEDLTQLAHDLLGSREDR